MATQFQTATELRGLGLPATKGTEGYFESKTQYDVAWGDILLAILTPQGSRPMNRSFGSTLYELLFDPISTEFELIKLVVRDAVTQWCPHLALRDVAAVAVDDTIQLGITFALRSDDVVDSQRRVVTIPKTYISTVR